MIDRSIALCRSDLQKMVDRSMDFLKIEIEFVHLTEMDAVIIDAIDLLFSLCCFCCSPC